MGSRPSKTKVTKTADAAGVAVASTGVATISTTSTQTPASLTAPPSPCESKVSERGVSPQGSRSHASYLSLGPYSSHGAEEPKSAHSEPPRAVAKMFHQDEKAARLSPPLVDSETVSSASAPLQHKKKGPPTLSAEGRSKTLPAQHLQISPLDFLVQAEALVANAASEAGKVKSPCATPVASRNQQTKQPRSDLIEAAARTPKHGGQERRDLGVAGANLPGMVAIGSADMEQDKATTGPDTVRLVEAVTAQEWDQAVQILKEASVLNPNVRTTDEFGYLLLRAAAEEGQLEVCQGLIQHKADVDARDSNGMTALMGACSGGDHTALVSLLLDAKANPSLNTQDGFTALAWAKRLGHQECASLLRAVGAGGDFSVF
mmetsp:Transcript_34124/g.77865  ORF Transcript_34124/g.77865 Transcript_34124/m.77865 type:complete len:375 (+) Transcript_34124:65-1189(+)